MLRKFKQTSLLMYKQIIQTLYVRRLLKSNHLHTGKISIDLYWNTFKSTYRHDDSYCRQTNIIASAVNQAVNFFLSIINSQVAFVVEYLIVDTYELFTKCVRKAVIIHLRSQRQYEFQIVTLYECFNNFSPTTKPCENDLNYSI